MRSTVLLLLFAAAGLVQANLYCYSAQNLFYGTQLTDVKCFSGTKYCFIKQSNYLGIGGTIQADCDYNYGNVCYRGKGCYNDSYGGRICCCTKNDCNSYNYLQNGSASMASMFSAFIVLLYSFWC